MFEPEPSVGRTVAGLRYPATGVELKRFLSISQDKLEEVAGLWRSGHPCLGCCPAPDHSFYTMADPASVSEGDLKVAADREIT